MRKLSIDRLIAMEFLAAEERRFITYGNIARGSNALQDVILRAQLKSSPPSSSFAREL